ncbi:MAG: hypothetical protein CML19_00155 [Pusillimonas sp.]|jgi:hypothetical protein|nr:hypothetical protein [Pusillimonas sp.]|tara:strand:+ start:477 stop:689 length:213 start_codon:yes stop_codon:yes gene_type:complete
MSDDLSRKNELDIIELRGEIKLLGQKIDTIKTNDLHHLQKSIDGVQKVLWTVGVLVLGHLGVAIKSTLWG